MRKTLLVSVFGVVMLFLMAFVSTVLGLSEEYIKIIIGEFENEDLLIPLLVLAYTPSFLMGVLTSLFERRVKTMIKTAVLSSLLSLILGGLLIGGASYLFGFTGILNYIIWVIMSGPLYIATSFAGIFIGYIIILVYILAKK